MTKCMVPPARMSSWVMSRPLWGRPSRVMRRTLVLSALRRSAVTVKSRPEGRWSVQLSNRGMPML